MWDPIIGCTRASPGYQNCYAEGQVHRGLHEAHKGLTECRWLYEPIECKGKQRFWNLFWDVERELQARLGELQRTARG